PRRARGDRDSDPGRRRRRRAGRGRGPPHPLRRIADPARRGPRPMTVTETRRDATVIHVSIWADLLGVDLHQHFVDAGGIRTRVLEAGSGPALVMIHGTGGHLEAYARNVRALSAHYRVVLYDMVGH